MGSLDSHISHVFDYFLVAIFFTYPAVLAERLRQSNAELQQAQGKIERLVLDKERQRIAGEIHDSVTQNLLGVKLLIDDSLKRIADKELVERLTLAKDAAGKALEQTRAAIDDLFEERFNHNSLCEITEDILRAAGRTHGIQIDFQVDGEEARLPADIKKAVYLIAQESVSNVTRHSGASKIEARLRFTPDEIELDIQDNGHGFTPGENRNGYGLSTISQRTRQFSGTVEIDSDAGGTRVRVSVPLETALPVS
jgi:signal transduction histidine kinase